MVRPSRLVPSPVLPAFRANRARCSAYFPTPIIRVIPMMSTTSSKCSSHAFNIGAITAAGRLLGVMFFPVAPSSNSGQWLTTKMFWNVALLNRNTGASSSTIEYQIFLDVQAPYLQSVVSDGHYVESEVVLA